MRYSRFKQQMEGTPVAPRKPRNSTPRPAQKTKSESAGRTKRKAAVDATPEADEEVPIKKIKAEPEDAVSANRPQVDGAMDSERGFTAGSAVLGNPAEQTLPYIQPKVEPVSFDSNVWQQETVLAHQQEVAVKVEPGLDE